MCTYEVRLCFLPVAPPCLTFNFSFRAIPGHICMQLCATNSAHVPVFKATFAAAGCRRTALGQHAVQDLAVLQPVFLSVQGHANMADSK